MVALLVAVSLLAALKVLHVLLAAQRDITAFHIFAFRVHLNGSLYFHPAVFLTLYIDHLRI